MQVTFTPQKASGTVKAPPSKSMAHRLLIAAAMSEGTSVVHGLSGSEDVCATLDCLAALGVSYTRNGDTATLCGTDMTKAVPSGDLYCRESGSTLRFMIPIALLSGNEVTLVGAPSLMKRPMGIYEDICREKGLCFAKKDNAITVKGPLPAGEYVLPGDVSSQFITGLLFALPCVGESRIRILPPFESRSYVDLTLSALRDFGVAVEWEDAYTLFIPANTRFTARICEVEGDYSNAAFLDALNLLGSDVTVTGLRADSLQGDRVYRDYFEALKKGCPTLNISDCPDLGPILFALAAAGQGGVFEGTRRLRIKESDRAAVMAEELAKFGTRVTVEEDRVTVDPNGFHAPTAPLFGHNDHRVVMSMAVLCTKVGGTVTGAEAVGKSYPDFFDDLKALGVETVVS
ncbi:MAG: 3-phosphoshikimate 1-carboxyvinyltransferase [Clostridia bacterium]|nr:3-phosphoshikimate 1-carboxyvinyltransferase [Clostridia bacterium]